MKLQFSASQLTVFSNSNMQLLKVMLWFYLESRFCSLVLICFLFLKLCGIPLFSIWQMALPYICFPPISMQVFKVQYFSYIVTEWSTYLESGALKIHCEKMTMLSTVMCVVWIGEWRCTEFDGNLLFDGTILWNFF